MLNEDISTPGNGEGRIVPTISRCQPWSHHDDAILTRLYRHDVIEELAELLGRTVKSIYKRANSLGLERAKNKMWSSYEIRIVRSLDGMIMYEKLIPAVENAANRRNIQIKTWHKMFEDKFITGEWELSVINGFEQFT